MKKFTKIALIVAAVLAGAGLTLGMIASVMGVGYGTLRAMARRGELDHGNWHLRENGLYYSSEKEGIAEKGETADSGVYRYPVDGIKNLEVDIGAASIIVAEGTDNDQIVVTLYDCKEKYYRGEMKGDTLEIEYGKDNVDRYSGNDSAKVQIEIPVDMAFTELDFDIGAAYAEFALENTACERLSMDIGAADVVASGFTVTELFDLEVGVGAVEIDGGTYHDIDMSCGMGDASMSGSIDGNLDVECGMGSVILDFDGNEDDYNYNLSCAMGELKVNGESYTAFDGSKQITNKGAVGTVYVDCGVGSVELYIR